MHTTFIKQKVNHISLFGLEIIPSFGLTDFRTFRLIPIFAK